MATIDNSKIFLGGLYEDVTVKVPANTTYAEGTVLGLDGDGNVTAFSSATTGSEPTYILANTLVNETSSAKEYTLSRVFAQGEVDKSKLIFATTADASDPEVLAAMKNNGFILRNVQQFS